jgi:hypothetical protein
MFVMVATLNAMATKLLKNFMIEGVGLSDNDEEDFAMRLWDHSMLLLIDAIVR